ncbi:MAG: NAD(P)H-hydrate dehydratase [Euryarchaeota archaeon]|nr:NAD(P)H-hydrate dehydratase [Euryarchaeota archaeon]
MLSVEEMRALEFNSEYFGVSKLQLMENAGKKIAEVIAKRFNPKNLGVKVFAGLGGNGGDGFVAARYLAQAGANVEVILLGRPESIRSSEAQKNWRALEKAPNVTLNPISGLLQLKAVDVDVIIDSILGIGLKTPVKGLFAQIVELINSAKPFKVSIDIPTGINADTGEVLGTAIKSDLTITFHDKKIGMVKAEQYIGEIIVADIGIPKEAEIYAGPGDVTLAIKSRPLNSHKGDFGKLLIIGGSIDYVGAPALTALGALRAGVDLAIVAAPEKVAWAINAISPDIITRKMPGDILSRGALPKLLDSIKKSTAVVIGPGLGTDPKTFEVVLEVFEAVKELKLPLLVDADAIKALASKPTALAGAPCVVTPHSGEFRILTGVTLPLELESRIKIVKEQAKKLEITFLLKANKDIIADPAGRVKINLTGNPGMTVGGTGDVLAGVVGAFLSQGIEPFRAAVAGAFINGLAGDMCAKEHGYQLIASDLLLKIPIIIRDLSGQLK